MLDKSKKRDWASTIVRVYSIVILGWSLLILLILLSTTPTRLDWGWLLVFAGVVVLSVDTVRITIQNWKDPKGIDIAPEVGLVAIGLGATAKHPLLFSFFYGMALLLGVLYLVKIFNPKSKPTTKPE